jgi:hypothetical protein
VRGSQRTIVSVIGLVRSAALHAPYSLRLKLLLRSEAVDLALGAFCADDEAAFADGW